MSAMSAMSAVSAVRAKNFLSFMSVVSFMIFMSFMRVISNISIMNVVIVVLCPTVVSDYLGYHTVWRQDYQRYQYHTMWSLTTIGVTQCGVRIQRCHTVMTQVTSCITQWGVKTTSGSLVTAGSVTPHCVAPLVTCRVSPNFASKRN